MASFDETDTCKTCGLPRELCGCLNIAREQQANIRIAVEKRKWGRDVTVITGIDSRIDLSGLAQRLKRKLATGGTHKDGRIELQGNHVRRVLEILSNEGFPADSIDIIN